MFIVLLQMKWGGQGHLNCNDNSLQWFIPPPVHSGPWQMCCMCGTCAKCLSLYYKCVLHTHIQTNKIRTTKLHNCFVKSLFYFQQHLFRTTFTSNTKQNQHERIQFLIQKHVLTSWPSPVVHTLCSSLQDSLAPFMAVWPPSTLQQCPPTHPHDFLAHKIIPSHIHQQAKLPLLDQAPHLYCLAGTKRDQ